MFTGWLSFAGTEIANAARLMAYRNALLPTLDLKDCGDCATFAEAMGDEPYTTPLADDAEWADPDRPESLGFLGFLPTSLSGFTDSTREAGVTQSLLDGGTVGRTRRGTRDMRVAGWLIGTSEAAAEAGFSWLKAALDGGSCADCEPGDDLCFLLACPTDTVEAESYTRHIRRVTCTSGPTRITERSLSGCGGFMINVEFGLTAGSPFVYSEPIVVAVAEGEELTAIVPGSLVFPMDTPLKPCLAPKAINGSGTILRDPDCPPVPAPPTAPSLSSSCKPITFNSSGYAYTPAPSHWLVDGTPAYEARPHIATNGTNIVVVYSNSPTAGQNVSSTVHARKGTSFATLGAEYTAYDEGSGTRGVEPAGLRWVPSKNKFIMGVVDFVPADTNYTTHYRGRFLTSTDGTTWSMISTLDNALRLSGQKSFLMTHIAHYDNGSTDGVLYAVGFGFGTVASGPTMIHIFRSTNFGTSWVYLGRPHPASTRRYVNPRIAIWPDGQIIITCTGVDTSSNLFMFKSSDGGRTWSAPKQIVTRAAGWPMPVIARDDTLFLFYRSMNDPGNRNLGRARYRISYDRGETWSDSAKMPWYDIGGEQGQDATLMPDGTLDMVMGLDATNTDANVYGGTITRARQYMSYAMYVPGEILKTWQDGVINLQIKTGAKATRQMRVTLLPRPLDGQLPEDLDPCTNCGSFIIDYAPANTIVYLDGMTERVTMAVGTGAPLPADHLVSGTDGGLFSWPLLTCGTGYYVIVDVDVETVTSLALGVVNRE
jgi:hypothetical protein